MSGATTSPTRADPRRAVPRTDAVLADERLAPAVARLGRPLVKASVTAAQARVRAGSLAPGDLVQAVLADLPASASALRPVLNATGVVLPSAAVSVPAALAPRLRRPGAGGLPVVARVSGERCLLDLRAVPEQADAVLADAVLRAAAGA